MEKVTCFALTALFFASFAKVCSCGEDSLALGQLKLTVPQGFEPAKAMLPEAQKADKSTNHASDVTGEYTLIWENIDSDFGTDEIDELKKYKVIFIPGFLSDLVRQYFKEQLSWLMEIGVDCKRIDIESEASPVYNARIIAKTIDASAKPVIIISHSKGGLDALQALISNRQLLKKIRGFVTIQTPFFGSPIADYVLNNKILRENAIKLLEFLGGSKDSLISLATNERAEYYRHNCKAISDITKSIPIITFASWKDDEVFKWDSIFEPIRNIMEDAGMKNDGLVPVKNAILPGADYIMMPGIDHAMTVMRVEISSFDRIRFTKTLLSMILAR